MGSSPIGHPITPQASFRAVLERNVAQIEKNARGALSSSDPEFLHQLRVGQRRLRAALRAYRDLLPSRKRRRLIGALRELSPILGSARDWDVLLAAARVGKKARAQAAVARAAALEAVASKRFTRMLERARSLEPGKSDVPLAQFAAAALERAHRKLMSRARDIDWTAAPRRHAVRIHVKRLRYTCEFFAPAFPGRATAPYVAALKELQSILGELNDIAVGRRLVGREADEAPLLRRLAPAWARFAKRRPFWRARA